MVAFAGDLRQVRDVDDLQVVRQAADDLAHPVGDRPGHAGVYFVEDDGRQLAVVRDDRFEAQHQPRHFAARGDSFDRLRRHVAVGREQKADVVRAVGLQFRCRRDSDTQLGRRHSQFCEHLFDLLFDVRDGFFASGGDFCGLLRGFYA